MDRGRSCIRPSTGERERDGERHDPFGEHDDPPAWPFPAADGVDDLDTSTLLGLLDGLAATIAGRRG